MLVKELIEKLKGLDENSTIGIYDEDEEITGCLVISSNVGHEDFVNGFIDYTIV